MISLDDFDEIIISSDSSFDEAVISPDSSVYTDDYNIIGDKGGMEVLTVPGPDNESPTCESSSDDCNCEVRACTIKKCQIDAFILSEIKTKLECGLNWKTI